MVVLSIVFIKNHSFEWLAASFRRIY